MTMYTIIFFYSDGSTEAHNTENITDTSAIEAGVLNAWYKSAMLAPILAKKFHLTGMVLINNRYHWVVENKTYIERGDRQC